MRVADCARDAVAPSRCSEPMCPSTFTYHRSGWYCVQLTKWLGDVWFTDPAGSAGRLVDRTRVPWSLDSFEEALIVLGPDREVTVSW
jgi:hypothetical protein